MIIRVCPLVFFFIYFFKWFGCSAVNMSLGFGWDLGLGFGYLLENDYGEEPWGKIQKTRTCSLENIMKEI